MTFGAKRFWGSLFCLFAFVAFSFAAEDAAYNQLLRNRKTPCGFYLARIKSEFNGRRITENLKPENLKEALHDFDPKTEKLVGVGAPSGWLARRKLRKQIVRELEAAGYSRQKFTLIREIGDFLEEKVGVFARYPDGRTVRLAGLDATDIANSVKSVEIQGLLSQGGSLLISGAPIIGPSRQKLAESVQAKIDEATTGLPQQPEHDVLAIQSKARVLVESAVRDPVGALSAFYERMKALLPYREDMVRPTDGEIRSMGQKVVMHTIFTLASFGLQRLVGLHKVPDPLCVVVPVTVINSANSGVTGTYRSFIGNWFSRNGNSMVTRNIKGMMLSSFFTLDLYLAHNMYDAQTHLFKPETFTAFAELSGWTHFFATNWVTILFQSVWRTPVLSLLHRWERWRSENKGPDVSAWARNMAGATEKFTTYVMTQLYLISVGIDTSMFKIIKDPVDGVEFLSGSHQVNDALGQTLLMNFNIGHLGMGLVGLSAFVMSKQYKAIDHIVPKIEWLDKKESAAYQWVINLFSRKKDGE